MIFQCPEGFTTIADCVQIDNVPVVIDWSLSGVSFDETMLIFSGGMFLWAVGVGIGLLISVVRKTRI